MRWNSSLGPEIYTDYPYQLLRVPVTNESILFPGFLRLVVVPVQHVEASRRVALRVAFKTNSLSEAVEDSI